MADRLQMSPLRMTLLAGGSGSAEPDGYRRRRTKLTGLCGVHFDEIMSPLGEVIR